MWIKQVFLKLTFLIYTIHQFLVEHFLFVYGGIRKLSLDSTVQNKVYIKIYFKILYGEFFDDFEYTHWRAVVVEVRSFIAKKI